MSFKRLSREEYAALWDDPRWQRVRLVIMSRDEWKCRLCGRDTGKMAVHHIKYSTPMPWDESHANLVCVCQACHGEITHCRNAEEENAFRKRLRKTSATKAVESQFADVIGAGLRMVTVQAEEEL